MVRKIHLFIVLLIALPFSAQAQQESGHEHADHQNHPVQKSDQHLGTHDSTHDSTHQSARTPKGLPLAEDIRVLLNQEMQEIRKGMEALVLAVASADWLQIAETGRTIDHSYILRRELTPAHKQQLRELLPQDFKVLDQQFHLQAGRLAQAAEQHDMMLVQFYQYRMMQSCTDCHARYAIERFPGFMQGSSQQAQHTEHHH